MARNIQAQNRRRKSERPYRQISRALLWHPPIRHRGDEPQDGLSPFEFHIGIGLSDAAQVKWLDERHAAKMEAGARKIATEKGHIEKFKRRWQRKIERREAGEYVPAPQREHAFDATGAYRSENMRRAYQDDEPRDLHKPIPASKAIKHAARAGYAEADTKPPPTIELSLSRSAILRAAGLPINGPDVRRVDAALDRLSLSSVDELPPLIVAWEEPWDRRIRIEVSASWFSAPFAKVPKSMPRAPAALAIFLFAHTIRTGKFNRGSKRFEQLAKLLGIPTRWGRAVAEREFLAALDTVNEHLATLPAARLDRAGMKVFKALRVEPGDGEDHIRLVHVPYRQDANGEPIFPQPIKRRGRKNTRMSDEELQKRAALERSREIRANLAAKQRARPAKSTEQIAREKEAERVEEELREEMLRQGMWVP